MKCPGEVTHQSWVFPASATGTSESQAHLSGFLGKGHWLCIFFLCVCFGVCVEVVLNTAITFLPLVTEMLRVWFWLFDSSSPFWVIGGRWLGIPHHLFHSFLLVCLDACGILWSMLYYMLLKYQCNQNHTRDNFGCSRIDISSRLGDVHNKYSSEILLDSLTFLLPSSLQLTSKIAQAQEIVLHTYIWHTAKDGE